MTQLKEIRQIIQGNKVSDGAGVQLTRLIGSPQLNMLDPFLLFDAFGSEEPQDYLAGFPPHPHRGFETVTYMLEGKMRHEDSAGHAGVIETGGVQWMTAGRGIIHSEMPEQEQGRLAGFQLWVNLPASDKMSAPRYQERAAEEVPVEQREDGITVKVIAGRTDKDTTGIIENTAVLPTYFHIHAPAGQTFSQSVQRDENSFVYLISGEVNIGQQQRPLESGQLAVLTPGEQVQIKAETDAEYLFVSALPLEEPVARGGPFVMNTREQIEQAFADYREGRFA